MKERGSRADFPFRDYYEDEDGERHTFVYACAIEQEWIFRALYSENGKRLCVKLTQRYCAEAHQLAHSTGFAPALSPSGMWTY